MSMVESAWATELAEEQTWWGLLLHSAKDSGEVDLEVEALDCPPLDR